MRKKLLNADALAVESFTTEPFDPETGVEGTTASTVDMGNTPECTTIFC